MKLSTVVNKIIPLSRAVRDYWDSELPKRHPNYPLVNEGEDSGPPPPEEGKLRELLESLPEGMIDKLLMLREISFWGYNPSKLEREGERLRDWYDEPSELLPQLAHDSDLGDDLAMALVKLKQQKLDLDKLSSQLPRVWK